MPYLLLTVVIWLPIYLYVGWYFSNGYTGRWFWIIFWGFSPLLIRIGDSIENFNRIGRPVVIRVDAE